MILITTIALINQFDSIIGRTIIILQEKCSALMHLELATFGYICVAGLKGTNIFLENVLYVIVLFK